MSFLKKCRPMMAAAFAAAILLGAIGPAKAEGLLPMISQTQVHRVDPVDAKNGHPQAGSPEFAFREGSVVRWFTSAANCGEYVADKVNFPDADRAVRVAFFGADPVLRFPNGVHRSDLGPVVAGNPAYAATYTDRTGARVVFWFQNRVTQGAFKRDSAKYLPAVGGYCPGAMAADHVTPGDPRNAYFIAEAPDGGVWGTFGSPNGPIAWAKLTPAERLAKYRTALANYERRTGIAPPKVALNGR